MHSCYVCNYYGIYVSECDFDGVCVYIYLLNCGSVCVFIYYCVSDCVFMYVCMIGWCLYFCMCV